MQRQRILSFFLVTDVSSLQEFNSVSTANHWPTLELPYNDSTVK